MIIKIILCFLFFSNYIQAEIYWSGKIDIPYNFYLKDYKNTENPIRLISLDINYGLENIDFKSNTAFEYKWNEDNLNPFNFREYYLSYYPSFGEINIGKQIITWGIADGNNPTDNINPYDLNFMFNSGIDRKIGIYSISSIIYYNDIKINLILSYDNFKNIKNERLPLPIPDKNNDKEFEYGFDFQYNMNQIELNMSYLMKKNIPILNIPSYNTTYSNVNILGLNLLYLYNELTIRFENALFFAANNEKFYQGIVQLEFPEIFDFTIGSQLFGTYNIDDSATGIYSIGSPVFLLTETSPLFSTSLSRTFNDDRLEINIFTMFEILGGYGSSIVFDANYNILDNFKTSIILSKFMKGNDKSAFNNLNNYSNIKLNIEYFF